MPHGVTRELNDIRGERPSRAAYGGGCQAWSPSVSAGRRSPHRLASSSHRGSTCVVFRMFFKKIKPL